MTTNNIPLNIDSVLVFDHGTVFYYHWTKTPFQNPLYEIHKDDATDHFLHGRGPDEVEHIDSYLSSDPITFLLNKWKEYDRIEIVDGQLKIFCAPQ